MGPGAPDVAGASGLMLILLAYFVGSFISAWIFFVKREISQNWAWYFRHSTGAVVGMLFAVIVCSGIMGIVYVFAPINNLWPLLFAGAPFLGSLLMLGKWLFPAAHNNPLNVDTHNSRKAQ